jgi:hypothetical protein
MPIKNINCNAVSYEDVWDIVKYELPSVCGTDKDGYYTYIMTNDDENVYMKVERKNNGVKIDMPFKVLVSYPINKKIKKVKMEITHL